MLPPGKPVFSEAFPVALRNAEVGHSALGVVLVALFDHLVSVSFLLARCIAVAAEDGRLAFS